MSMQWSLYSVATYGHGSRQGVRSGHPDIGSALWLSRAALPCGPAHSGAALTAASTAAASEPRRMARHQSLNVVKS
jgi:hypothetical protein